MNDARLLEIAARERLPLYVYDLDVVRTQYHRLRDAFGERFRVHYAMKANWHEEILRTLRAEGCGVECVSIHEVTHAMACGFTPGEILFTCSAITDEELLGVHDLGVRINCDSLHQVRVLCDHGASTISLRINANLGRGSHAYLVTGGQGSKFGIHLDNLDAARAIAADAGVRIAGLHQHIGSHIEGAADMLTGLRILCDIAEDFPDLEYLDMGGGFWVPYRDEEHEIDVEAMGAAAREELDAHPRLASLPVLLESGRFLVAQAGVLLARVVDVKHDGATTFVGVDTGMNHLIRPALYAAWHRIDNLTREGEPVPVVVAGNACESADILGTDRLMPLPRIGDVLAIRTAGAYGFAMASRYALRPLPGELCVDSQANT